jgi:hypothetical protein
VARVPRAPISQDIGALVTFFDLLILHRQLPAFDFAASFLSTQVNPLAGENIIQDVIVPDAVKDAMWEAVVAQLQDRVAGGAFVPAAVARQIITYLAASVTSGHRTSGPSSRSSPTSRARPWCVFFSGTCFSPGTRR